jgi:hypothetical protein
MQVNDYSVDSNYFHHGLILNGSPFAAGRTARWTF